MSVRKILYIGLCFSGLMCLRAFAMTPASDAELVGVTAAADGDCIGQGGDVCSYTPSTYCPEFPNSCTGYCHIVSYGPSNNDKCREDDTCVTWCEWANGWCVKYKHEPCNLIIVPPEMHPVCACILLLADEWTEGTRNICTTKI